MNETKTMYHAVPVVSELNRVKGFDPTRYLRKTKEGPKLDLSLKKLWFRLKYPNGRIKLSALKITDQLAIIEARVYFDKADSQPVSSFTAKTENQTTPGGLYIEMAQHNAIDEALSAAGFGVQFIPATEAENASFEIKAAPTQAEPIKKEEKAETPKVEPIAKEIPKVEPTVTEEAVAQVAPQVEVVANEAPVMESPIAEIPTVEEAPAPIEEAVPTVDVSLPTVETAPVPEVTEIREADNSLGYTSDMPVEQILSRMSVDEARNYIVPVGACKGWTLEQVADRRPISLKWYLTAYNGDDNILKAAATIMQKLVDSKAA